MKWLHFILSHSIFIAVCAVALAFQTAELLQLHNSLYLYGFIFFATLCSYNFYWIISKAAFAQPGALRMLLKKKMTGLVILILSAIGLCFCLVQYPLPAVFIITAFLLTCLYALPLLPFSFLYFTRKAGVLKTVLLAFTWAYVTVIIPLQKDYLLLNNAGLFVFTRRFLFMLMLCIIFDNRDKTVDKIRGLHSLATDLKPAHLRMLIFFIFVILFTTNFLYSYYRINIQPICSAAYFHNCFTGCLFLFS
ncbi:MAG: hypothetical protein WDM90_23050 [Ferruginibacter sp.]